MPSLVPGVEEPRAATAEAIADLRYIRRTMERATFTAVSGSALCGVGVVALVAAAIARWGLSAPAGSDTWLSTWAAAGIVSTLLVGLAFRKKARRNGVPGSTRKLLLGMGAPLLAVAVISAACRGAGAGANLFAGVWLTGYGGGVVSAGAFSTRSIPALGAGCMALGGVAFLLPPSSADLWLAAGFGLFHLVVGLRVARRHGG